LRYIKTRIIEIYRTTSTIHKRYTRATFGLFFKDMLCQRPTCTFINNAALYAVN